MVLLKLNLNNCLNVIVSAPGAYEVDKADQILDTSAAYSFGIKTSGPRKDNVPGM